MTKWDVDLCFICQKEHRKGYPDYVPPCPGSAGAYQAVEVGEKFKAKDPAERAVAPVEAREFEPEGEVVPDWAYDLGVRRKRELDEPVVQKKDRLSHNVAMRAYRLRKVLRARGWDDEAIDREIVAKRAVWEMQVRSKRGGSGG